MSEDESRHENVVISWDNRSSEAAPSVNSKRPLTHSLDATEEGLAMKATPNTSPNTAEARALIEEARQRPNCGDPDCLCTVTTRLADALEAEMAKTALLGRALQRDAYEMTRNDCERGAHWQYGVTEPLEGNRVHGPFSEEFCRGRIEVRKSTPLGRADRSTVPVLMRQHVGPWQAVEDGTDD